MTSCPQTHRHLRPDCPCLLSPSRRPVPQPSQFKRRVCQASRPPWGLHFLCTPMPAPARPCLPACPPLLALEKQHISLPPGVGGSSPTSANEVWPPALERGLHSSLSSLGHSPSALRHPAELPTISQSLCLSPPDTSLCKSQCAFHLLVGPH